MAKEAVFTLKLEKDLRTDFMAAAAGEHRPAAQVVRELMRGYVNQRREAREYDQFLHRKVERARAQRDAGRHASNEDVESEAAVRRAMLQRRADESDL